MKEEFDSCQTPLLNALIQIVHAGEKVYGRCVNGSNYKNVWLVIDARAKTIRVNPIRGNTWTACWFMLGHPRSETRATHAQIQRERERQDETFLWSYRRWERKRKRGWGVGDTGLSTVFRSCRLFVHRRVLTFLFARPLYMAAHTYGYAFIYPDWAHKNTSRYVSGIIRSSKQDCSDGTVAFVSAPFACRSAALRARPSSRSRCEDSRGSEPPNVLSK